MNQMAFWLKYFLGKLGDSREEGQGLIEYALLVALIAIVVIAVLLVLGPEISNIFQYIKDQLALAQTP